MRSFARVSFAWLVVVVALLLGQCPGHAAEVRFALVVGNDDYKAAKLTTPANDAGLIADALQAAGFTVTGASNLDQATLRESFREFVDQVAAAGPDAVALVYLAGFGLQFQGDNYFVPVDADIQRDVDVPLQAIRIADLAQPLATLPGRVKIIVLDAARENPFAGGGRPLAGGLALVDAAPTLAVAFNAAPGTVGPQEPGPYGAYATSLAEMISAGGLGLDDIFVRLRLRVSELTQGAEVPWYASGLDGPFFFTELAADAPPPPNVMPIADIRVRPMRDFTRVEDAYAAALEIDSIDGYQQFLAIYPDSPFSRRIAAMLAVRREAMIWRRCVMADTPQAFWSYLRRYPNGPHVADAQRELMRLSVAMEPPPDFVFVDFGVPPPPPAELVFVDKPVLMFAGPAFAPPPPPPVLFLPPRPREFAVLAPPPRPTGRFLLPTPVAFPVHAFVRPPPTVALRVVAPGAAPGGRPALRVSLPGAVQRASTGTVGEPAGRPEPGPGAPKVGAPKAGALPHGAPPPPATAAVKPAPVPVHPVAPAPVVVRPGAPPPPPPGSNVQTNVKPAPVAPHVGGPVPVVKPAPPAPPPHVQNNTPAVVRTPAPPPPPHPAAPAPAQAKPAPCPPGHSPVSVGGRTVCK